MKRKLNKKKLIIFIIIIICFFSLIFSLFKIVTWFIDNNNTNNEINTIKQAIIENDIVSSISNGNISNIKEEGPNKKIDFNGLYNTNNDVVGWIKVNNTKIDYPYVQTNNNTYYLNHTFKKKKSDSGWIFLDYRNDTEFSNKNNIIYGHARKDETMFGTLKKIIKPSWYNNENNQIIEITTPYFKYYFQTFSVYNIKTESYYIQTTFNNDDSFKEFIKTIKNRSLHNFDIYVNEKDTILTLSTCYKTNQKIVLHSKLIKKETID